MPKYNSLSLDSSTYIKAGCGSMPVLGGWDGNILGASG